jgi:putative radical SAM enzyme (TIGR03279 family)
MVRVSRVIPGSIADQLGIVPGTEFASVDGRAIDDFLDWEFLTADDAFLVLARFPDGQIIEFDLERPEGESLGIELEPPSVRRCANRCEFCFIEGLPKGLRKNLYIRDDDYRLSFAYGNFATLSNLKDKDETRIIEYRLSPLYVSVHATPWEARKKLLNNPRVPNVLEQLSRLAAHGIQFHCQMVIVPGLNDGDVLERSLADLWDLGDAVLTVAVVPVGLTHFNHLFTGKSMSAADAQGLIAAARRWGTRALIDRGMNWVYGSDELYLLAGATLPDASHYDDFPQVENGVGAVASLRERVQEGLSQLPPLAGKRVGVVTGLAMRELLPELLEKIAGACGAQFELIVAESSLFGPTITTAGLLVGADIRRVLAGRAQLDLALIPAESMNDDGVFLDDESFASVADSLPMPIRASYDFVDALSGGNEMLLEHRTVSGSA